MRIKRFTAPDMRTALRMVRDEQGPDAVILSNRATADGIEVVAATDYDEALVAQALRAAAPAMETAAPAASADATATDAVIAPKPAEIAAPFKPERIATTAATAVFASAAPRESLMSRARAMFRIGDGADADEGPTLAELTAASAPARKAPVETAPVETAPVETAPVAAAPSDVAPKLRDSGSRFEEMMAAFNPPAPVAPAAEQPAGPNADIVAACSDPRESDADYLISLATGQAPLAAADAGEIVAPTASIVSTPRLLHAVATDGNDTDPTIVAMRRELATMRQLMERQMEQLSLERLRGSPARAEAFETLLGLGCDTAIAQAVAADLDPRIAPADVHEPMLAGLIRTLRLTRSEPIDEGGVIALVGPTGAGKTTTAAKLAARFAARHRARDVALVSIDGERTGAREQLHALGRRLGVTVCDADSSDTLGRALDQLADYPLVLVDTAGYGVRDRALLRQILWLRSTSRLRSLLVLPANAHPHDLAELVRRYRPAAPDGAVLTKLDESGRLGSALSVLVQNELPLAYLCAGQQVPDDLDVAGADALTEVLRRQVQERGAIQRSSEERTPKLALQKSPGAADNPLAIEERHAFV